MVKVIKISGKECSAQQLFDYQKIFANLVKDPGLGNKVKSLGYLKIWDEVKLYNGLVAQQGLSFLRSNYYFLIIDSQIYIEAYKNRDEQTLKTLSDSIKEACLFNYRQACSIDRDDNCVINFPYIGDFKPKIIELYPDLNGKI